MLKSFRDSLLFTDFELYKKQIRRDNREALQIILVLGALVFLAAFLLQLLFAKVLGTQVFDTWGHVLEMLAVFAFAGLYYITERRDSSFEPLVFLYVFIGVLLLASVLFDTIFIPDNNAFMFMIMLVLLPALIIDKPWRVALFVLAFAGVFWYHCNYAKDYTMMIEDTVHLIVCTMLSLVNFGVIFGMRVAHYKQTGNVENTAVHDKLTGIYNRWGGETLIRNYVTNSLSGTLMIIDLDNFKHINDTYGHAVGDEVIKGAAEILTGLFRENDTVMRMGGDEYVVYALGMVDRNFVEKKLMQINENMHGIHPDKEGQEHQ